MRSRGRWPLQLLGVGLDLHLGLVVVVVIVVWRFEGIEGV
jgi:hypothetical protein